MAISATSSALGLHLLFPITNSSKNLQKIKNSLSNLQPPNLSKRYNKSIPTYVGSWIFLCKKWHPIIAKNSSAELEVSNEVRTAKDAVNLGLSLFKKGKIKDALLQFDKALLLNPSSEEAKVALYNKACCHSYRQDGSKAADALRKALRDYNLKFSIILEDPDMAPFRAMPEFRELQNEARMGGSEIGNSFRRDLKLLSEVRAPFRGIRKFFYVALCAAAGIATFFTLPRLIQAVQGGTNAPNLSETATNAVINIGGFFVLVALFIWDNRKEEEQMTQITREETLSRLPLRLSTNRIVELSQMRENYRPVILAGKEEIVSKAVQKAEKFRADLVKRGILLIPLVWSDNNQAVIKKKGFGSLRRPTDQKSSDGDDFEKRTQDIALKSQVEAEKRFKAEVVSVKEWESWVREQQESEGVQPGENVYIILRLDGRVRKSGLGMPVWNDIIKDVPTLESLVSKLEK